MRCPRCCDTVTVNGVLEALTVIASAADMVTDLLVLVQFYLDGQDTFFIISLCVILLAQVTFALTFTVERAEVRGDTWRAHRRRLAIFVGVFPVAQLVPILAYLTSTFELPRLQRLLKRLGVGGESEPRAPGTTSWEKVKNKVHAHRGFLLEAFAEAIPQCALQLIAALTVDHFTTLSAISIFLSISVIASKSWVVAWSPHAPTMAFNTLCIVADIVGFFASLAWLFAVDQLPAVHAMHQSLRGWLLGVISLTALGGASCLGLFALAVLFDELRFQTSRAEHARGPRRNWPKKFLWVPPAMVPLLYWLALVPVGVIYLLARWTLVALCCGTMGQQEKEKLHRDIVDRMLAFIEHGKTLTPRSFRQGSYRFRRRLGGGPTRRRLPLASLIDETQQGLVRLPPGLTMATQQELRERALITLLRLATAEHKHSLKGLPAVARRGMHENGREILATRLAVAGHRGAPGAIVADAAAAASGRSTGSRRSLWPASTRTTSASRPQGAATGAGGAAGEVNANMARGLDSRTLRWLVLLLVQRSCFHSPRQRANAKLTLQTQALGPCSDGRLSGLLQAGAGLMFGSAAVVGVLWLLLSIPLLVLSVIYPLLQPILYGAARLGDDGRDSGLRGRVTRRQNAPQDQAAAAAHHDDDDHEDDGSAGSSWKQEMESIMAGTHPALIEGLEKHEKIRKHAIAQADHIRQLQTVNINNLADCEKKQAEDEKKAHMEFFKVRLIDSLEEKQKKATRQSGLRTRRSEDGDAKDAASKRRQINGLTGLDIAYSLKPEEAKADLDEIQSAADRYSVRSAAIVSDDLRNSSTGDAYFNRSQQQLHCNGHAFERGSTVFVYQQGQRVEDLWTLTAMNAVEVTLRDNDGAKLKVTLAQLRNGRFVFRPGDGQYR